MSVFIALAWDASLIGRIVGGICDTMPSMIVFMFLLML